jgi:hypothetical protein
MTTLPAPSWLTRQRILVYAAILAATWLLLAVFIDYQTRPGGGMPMITDFNTFYAVSLLMRDMPVAGAFDGATMHAYELIAAQAAYGGALSAEVLATIPLFPWMYPPLILPLLAPLALLPYALAQLALTLSSLALFLLAARRAIPDGKVAMLVALAFPATLLTLVFGQTGFLIGGLFGLGLMSLERRPWLAGLCFGLMTVKPHLGLLIPLALVLGGQWRAIAGAMLTLALLGVLTVALWGVAPWQAFLGGTGMPLQLMDSRSVPWTLMPTAYAGLRLAGASTGLAYAAQGLAVLIAVVSVAWAWLRPGPLPLRAAVLVLASTLANPFDYVYDLPVLALALLWLGQHLATRRPRAWEMAAMACLFATPLAAPGLASAVAVQPAALAILVVLGVALNRLRGQRTAL